MIINTTHTPWRVGMALMAITFLTVGCGGGDDENNEDNKSTVVDMDTVTPDMDTVTPDMDTVTPDMPVVDEDMPVVDEDMPVDNDMPIVDEDMPADMPIDEDMPADMDPVDMDPGDAVDEIEPNDDPEADTLQNIAPGSNIKGSISEYDGSANPDIDIFRVTLSAGDIYEWQISEVGAGITAAGVSASLYAETGDIELERYLSSNDTSDTRQAFIPEDGDYFLAVFDLASAEETPENHGGVDATYQIDTRLATPITTTIAVPGMDTGDLADGAVDVFTFTYTTDETFQAEIIGSRDPINSSIDSVLAVWDVADSRLVSFNDDIDLNNDIYDSALLAGLENGKDYYLVVDGWTIGNDTAYQLSTSTTTADADTPDNPIPLVAGGTFTGGIGDADAANEIYDTDYFTINVQPGETIKISALATGSMINPRISVLAESIFGFVTVASGKSVEGLAAVSFNNPTDAAAADYFVLVDDEANIPTDENDDPDYTGGADYGYTLTTEAITWMAAAQTLPISVMSTYSAPGEYAWYDVPVIADSIIVLSASSTNAEPVVAWFDTVNGLAADETITYLPTMAGNRIFGTRDADFRGDNGASTFDFDFSVVAYDYSAITFANVMEAAGNNAIATPQALTAPAAVTAATQQDIELAATMTPTNDYYTVSATAGQRIIIFTSSVDPAAMNDADTVVTLFDAAGTELGNNDDLLTDEFSTFSALVVEAPADGVYTIEVAPFSDAEDTNGDYLLNAFVQ